MTEKRTWLFGGVAGIILLFLLGFFLLVNPVRNQAAETWDEVALVDEGNARLEAKIAQLEQQASEVPAKLAEIEVARRKMPAEIKQSQLVRAIESEAESAGVELTGIAPSAPTQLEGTGVQIVALPMGITATGRYPNIRTFVDNLERLERAFLINSLEVTAADTATEDFTLTLSGDFFSLPEGTLDVPVAPEPDSSAIPDPAQSAAAAARIDDEPNPDATSKADEPSGNKQSGAKADKSD